MTTETPHMHIHIGKASVSLEEGKTRPILIGTLICRRAPAVEMALYGSFVITGFGYSVTFQFWTFCLLLIHHFGTWE